MRVRVAVLLAVLAVVASVAPAAALAMPSDSSEPTLTPTDGTPTRTESAGTATPAEQTATPTATPAATSSPTPTPNTSSGGDARSESDGPTIEELSEGGRPVAKDAQSLRMTSDRFWWLIAWPPGSSGAPNNDKWRYVGAEGMQTVKKNAVYLRTFALDSGETDLKVAYWEPAKRTVERGNTTETVRYAENVSVTTQTLDYQRGRPTIEVPLKRHDRPVKVTMWLEDSPETRWVFGHHSVATTQTANIDSEGDYLRAVILDFGWIIVAGLITGGLSIRAAMRRAGVGPQRGYLPWVLAWSISTGLALFIDYSAIANFVVANPWSIAVWIVVLGLFIMLETFQQNVKRVRFVQPEVEEATSPRGESRLGRIGERERTKRIVKLPDGKHAIVTPGFFAFLARLFGKPATFDNYDERAALVEVNEGSVDEKIYIDPDADEILDIEPEGFSFAWHRTTKKTTDDGALVLDDDGKPETETTWNVDRIMVSCLGAAGVGSLAWLALGPFVALFATTAALLVGMLGPKHDAYASAEFAPAHLESVHSSMIAMRQGLEDAKTFEEMERELGKAHVQPVKTAMGLMRGYSEGVNGQMHDVYAEFGRDEPDPDKSEEVSSADD